MEERTQRNLHQSDLFMASENSFANYGNTLGMSVATELVISCKSWIGGAEPS